MLDRKYILDHIDQVRANCRNRRVQVDLNVFVRLDELRRELDRTLQELNRQSKELSRQSRSEEAAEARATRGRELRAERAALEERLRQVASDLTAIQSQIPNLTHPDAPIGKDASDNREVARGRTTVPTFDFPVSDHVDIGTSLGILDFKTGARVAGHGFYFLVNEGVQLELALQQFALAKLLDWGFIPYCTPDVARNDLFDSIGYIPRGPESQIYSIEGTQLSLIATAEITLGGLYGDRVASEQELPIRVAGISHCFRTEAGAHGKASRGLYRVHQFTKVEMFVFSHPGKSEDELDRLVNIQREIFDELEIPYRVVDTATGDLGGPAYRKFDLEAWMPGRDSFGEVTSASNCTDYQARRLQARYRSSGQRSQFVHTLNGTAIANSRAILSILENHQRQDGSVNIPEALRSYMGAAEIRRR